ncbi:MAG: superoxide dismutase, Ni [Pseudomonadota bacterium]
MSSKTLLFTPLYCLAPGIAQAHQSVGHPVHLHALDWFLIATVVLMAIAVALLLRTDNLRPFFLKSVHTLGRPLLSVGRFVKSHGWSLPIAQAHCDIPCGIYDPMVAQVQAMSVARFLDQIAELGETPASDAATQAKLSRLVREKEKHAMEVKQAIVVIWGDYFKPEHFETYPGLAALTHEILRTASACKQNVEPKNGRDLVDRVNDFAALFWESKGVEIQRCVAAYSPGLELVQPKLASA